jgi:putative intracellular protease/amidase
LTPDPAAAALAEQVGSDHVITIAGGTHSPMRTRPEATVLAMLRALQPN